MLETKKLNMRFFIGTIVASFSLYLITDFFCTGDCYVLYETSYLDPLFFILLGLVPTAFTLLFFSEKVFFSWAKHIAWWFILLVAWAVSNNENESDFSPAGDDISVVSWSMAVLFVITLIYAIIMNWRLKKNP